jgi:hypothetical protein
MLLGGVSWVNEQQNLEWVHEGNRLIEEELSRGEGMWRLLRGRMGRSRWREWKNFAVLDCATW